jgi:hypothetical protein
MYSFSATKNLTGGLKFLKTAALSSVIAMAATSVSHADEVGGYLSFTSEDSAYFGYPHWIIQGSIAGSFGNGFIGQLDFAHSNYHTYDYPVSTGTAYLGYKASSALSLALTGGVEDFDGYFYTLAGIEAKYSADRFDVEFGARKYLSADGDPYDGHVAMLIGTYHIDDALDVFASYANVDDDGDPYAVLGVGARKKLFGGGSSAPGGLYLQVGLYGGLDGGSKFEAAKITIGKTFGSGSIFKPKGWLDAVPAWY